MPTFPEVAPIVQIKGIESVGLEVRSGRNRGVNDRANRTRSGS